jgi:beta-mannosidase
MSHITNYLNSGWKFRQVGGSQWLDAKVPGTVHTDLKRHGLIGDPFYRTNENEVQWVEENDWEYKTTFIVDRQILDHDTTELVFEGLDTYADVYLNNRLILQSENMFVGQRVNCKPLLKLGENEMRVYFHSPVSRGLNKRHALGYQLPMQNEQAPANRQTSVFTRKAPFHYGWDWGPRLVTSGVWRHVRLVAWSGAMIRDVYPATTALENRQAKIAVQMEIDVMQDGVFEVAVVINGEEKRAFSNGFLRSGINRLQFDFLLDEPRLWWPNGLGEAYLYDFEFRLCRQNILLSAYRLKHGVRTLKLLQQPDVTGRSFSFQVNGIPVFMKGANMIPPEMLTPEVTEETHQKLVGSAVNANMNMLRVWGGGIYGEDRFYELCSENGILVWQDFMFACAMQPPVDAHLESIRKEAEYNVRCLRNHTCLALWCGNNEILYGWNSWGWQDMFNPEFRDKMWEAYQRIFHDILPGAVQAHDPKTQYWASSPSTYENQPPDRKSGDEHDWTVWFGQKPIASYWDNVPRFVSEWGLQSLPEMATIRAFAQDEDLSLRSVVMRHRQRCRMDWLQKGFTGSDMIMWYQQQYFDSSDAFERQIYLSQLLQALAYKTAIEAHRTARPHCMGSLYWQLNDCWPAISWSSVDYFFRWKAAHYAVRKAFAPVIITAKYESGRLGIYVVSDKLQALEARLQTEMMDFNGKNIFTEEMEIKVSPNSSELALTLDISRFLENDHAAERLINLSLFDDSRIIAANQLYFAKPKELKLLQPSIKHTLSKIQNGYLLAVTSGTLVRGLQIKVPDPDAHFSDNYYDLLPGREVSINISNIRGEIGEKDVGFEYLN